LNVKESEKFKGPLEKNKKENPVRKGVNRQQKKNKAFMHEKI